MNATPLTRNDLVRTLGEVDDVIASQILQVGATLPELKAALELLEDEAPALERPDATEHVTTLMMLLRDLDVTEPEPEYLGTD